MSIFTGQINVNETLSFINTDILSKIKEGLVLTKDYALELGGRYIQYAMTVDAIKIAVFFILFRVSIYFLKRIYKRARKSDENYDYDGLQRLGFAIFCIAPILFLIFTIQTTIDLVKRKFIPEVQMYQVIMDIKNGNTSSNDG